MKPLGTISGVIFLLFVVGFFLPGYASGFSNGVGPASTLVMPPGDGIGANDGATAANSPSTGTHGNGATTSAPAITTNTNGDIIVSIVGTNANTTIVNPSAPTVIVPSAQPLTEYQMFAGYQVQTTAGTLAARSGSQDTGASGDWTGMSLALVPIPGQTPMFTVASGSPTDGYVAANGTETFSWGTTPANGTLIIACVAAYSTTNVPTGTIASTFNAIPNNPATNSHQSMYCYYRWAHNEPSSYTMVAGSGSGLTGFVFAVANVGAFDMPLTSASANWGVGDTYKDLCLIGGLNGTKQACGQVGFVSNSTTIYPTFIAQASLSNEGYLYCTDHTLSWVSNAANFLGGSFLAPAGYDCANGDINGRGNTTIVWPTKMAIALQGQAGGWAGCGAPTQGGSALFDMSTNATTPFMSLGSSALDSAQSGIGQFTISQMSINGGIGCAHDGGGSDGLQVVNAHQIRLYNNRFSNFANYDVNMDADSESNSGADASLANNIFVGNWFTEAGSAGLAWRCTNNGTPHPNIQNGLMLNNEYTNNNLQGLVYVNCDRIWNETHAGEIFQDNYLNNSGACGGTCYEIQTSSSDFYGSTFQNEYFENDESGTYAAANQATDWTGATWSNEFYTGTISAFLPMFTAAGPAIASCGLQLSHIGACVSDSTACTAATTYASGGGTLCMLQCNGTNWKETGSTAGCY